MRRVGRAVSVAVLQGCEPDRRYLARPDCAWPPAFRQLPAHAVPEYARDVLFLVWLDWFAEAVFVHALYALAAVGQVAPVKPGVFG